MKVNAMDTGSVFEKVFSNYLSNSKKKSLTPDRSKKSFSFSIYSPYFKNAAEVLAFFFSKGNNSMWHVLQGVVNTFTILFPAQIYPNNVLHMQFQNKPQYFAFWK